MAPRAVVLATGGMSYQKMGTTGGWVSVCDGVGAYGGDAAAGDCGVADEGGVGEGDIGDAGAGCGGAD